MDYFDTPQVSGNWFHTLLQTKFDRNPTKNLLHKIVQTSSQEIIREARLLNNNFYFNYFKGEGFSSGNFEERYQRTLEPIYNEEMEMPFPDDQIKPVDCFFGYTELSSSNPRQNYFIIGGSLDITNSSEPDSEYYRKNFLQREDFNLMFNLFRYISHDTDLEFTTLHRIVDTITLLGQLDVSELNEDGDVTLSDGDEENVFPIVERDTRVTASYYLEFLINCFIYLMNKVRNFAIPSLLQQHRPYVFDRFVSSTEPNTANRVVNFLQTNQDNSEYTQQKLWMRSTQQYDSLSILLKILSMNTCVNDTYVNNNMLRFADLNVTVGNNPVITSYTQVQRSLLKIFLMFDININEIETNANVTPLEFARLQYNHISNQAQNENGEKQPLYDRIVQDYSGIVNLVTSLVGDNNLKEDISSVTQQKEMSKILSPLMGNQSSTYSQSEILTSRQGGPTIGPIKRKAQTAAQRASRGDRNYPKPINPNLGGKKNNTKKHNKKKNKKTKKKVSI
jgi:hypothetical protein